MLNPSETLAEKFIKRGAWLYFFAFITGPIGYVIKIILSNDLSVDEIGILYGVISLISLLSVYHDLGLTESMNYFLPKFIVEKNYSRFKSLVFYSLIAQVITSLCIGWILFLASGPIAEHYFHSSAAKSTIEILCLFFLGVNLHNMSMTIFWVSQNTRLQKWTEFLRMIAVLLFTWWLWFTKIWTLMLYAWAWNIGVFIGIIIGWFFMYRDYYLPYLKEVPIRFEKDLAKQVVRYALWVMLAANVGTILWQIDMQLIIYLLGTKDAGYYTNYLSIIGMPFLLLTPIIGFLFPVISELHGKKDETKIKAIKGMFYKYFSVLGIVTGVFMFVFGPEIASVFFGDKFRFSGTILQYSAFFIVFNFLLQIDFQILAGIGKIQKRVKILSVGLVVNIILNLILIQKYWVAGSALAVGASWVPIWYLANRITKNYSEWFDFQFLLKNLCIASLLWIFSYFYILPEFIGVTRIKGFIFILITLIFYIIPLVLANRKELRIFLGEIRKIMANKKSPETIEDVISDSSAV